MGFGGHVLQVESSARDSLILVFLYTLQNQMNTEGNIEKEKLFLKKKK